MEQRAVRLIFPGAKEGADVTFPSVWRPLVSGGVFTWKYLRRGKIISEDEFSHFIIWRLYIKYFIMFGIPSQQAILICSTETTLQWESKYIKKNRGCFSNSPEDVFGFSVLPSKPTKYTFQKSKHFFRCSRLNESRKAASPEFSVQFLTPLIIL